MPTSKEASTAAAMQAVFQTSELVENILVHLPAKNIFGVQRVSKSFRNAVRNSLPIKEKLFLRLRARPEVGQKVIVYGFQHAVATLNPVFIQGAFPGNYTVQQMTLSSRNELHEKYGVTIGHECAISMESDVLDTYLLDVPLRKVRLSLRPWVGEGGPTVIIDEVDIDAGEPMTMTIRAMVDAVLGNPQEIGLAFEEDKWRRCHARCPRPDRQPRPYEGNGGHNGGWLANGQHFNDYERAKRKLEALQADRARFIPDLLPHLVGQSLLAAKVAGRETGWRCETLAKPSEILRDLQAVADPGSRVYISLSQQPTFLLRDIVVPSPKDWAAIEARGR